MTRNILPIILILLASVLSLNCQTKASGEKVKPCKYLSFEDAEKILNSKVELVTNSWDSINNKTVFNCIYQTAKKDETDDSEQRVLFLFEEFPNETEAKKVYREIWDSNKNHAGIEVLKNVGDEAYFHTDGENFSFVMARKGKYTIRFKVRRLKAIRTTSFDELKAVSKKIMEQI